MADPGVSCNCLNCRLGRIEEKLEKMETRIGNQPARAARKSKASR